jgi:TonB-dependent receptor
MMGGLYRDKKRNNFYNEYEFRPVDPYERYGEDFNDYRQIQWIVENPRGSVGTSLNYQSFEKINAEFLQFKGSEKKVEIIGGVRIENTDQGYDLDYPIGESRPNGKQTYTDVLPSLHFKYMPGRKINIRASYFRSVNRPGFFEIVPYTIVNEDYVERGNPDLKHAVADNIDIRFENFPNPAEQFMAAVFYKHIQNPIEYILKPDSIRGQDIYFTPGNFGNATNYGAEIDFIKYFNKVGIKVNYTYTHSRITTTKSKRIRDENGNLKTIAVNETRPLYGQSAHIGNVSVLYKDTKKRWDAQLALQYTGERINSVSQFAGNDLWQKPFIQMDASLEKKFKNGLGIFAKSNNLLNTPMIVYLKNASSKNIHVPTQSLSGKTLIRQNYYQRSYYLGIRYAL